MTNQNILFIMVDTLRAQNLGCYGFKPSPSPNLDILAQNGVVFQNAYATCTKTDPSTTCMMTGQYPLSLGLFNHGPHITPKEEARIAKIKLLPEILHKNGYYTAAFDYFGRWHGRGYDYYSGKIVEDKFTDPLDRLGFHKMKLLGFVRLLDKLALKFFKRDFFLRAYHCFISKGNPKDLPFYDPAEIMINETIKVLDKIKKKKFFIYLHFWDPHFPLSRPWGLKAFLFNSMEDRYNAEINYLDRQLARLFVYLRKNGLMEKTLVVFTGDHGESLTEHAITISHQGLFEQTVKVPLILVHLDLPAKNIPALVQHVDLQPTILDFLGLKGNGHEDGISLLPLIYGKKRKIRGVAFFDDFSYPEMIIKKGWRSQGIRMGHYKYIRKYLNNGRANLYLPFPDFGQFEKEEMLFDLDEDPRELNNLVEKKKQVLGKVRKTIDEFLAKLKRNYQKNTQFLSSREKKQKRLAKEDDDKERLMKRLRNLGYF